MALYSISLCTGLAGIELGIDIACPGAFEPVLYVEHEIAVAEILAARIAEWSIPSSPIWSDVRTICDEPVREYIRRRTGVEGIGLLTAGYPCTPFSLAGKRRGKDDPRHLWPWIVDAIDCYRPAMCFFENVAGHLSMGFGTVRRNLEERGYAVSAGLFSAAEVGAPHQRLRLFILAVDDSARHGNNGRDGEAVGGRGVRETSDKLANSGRRADEQSRAAGVIRGTTEEAGAEASEREWRGDAAGDGGVAMADTAERRRGELREPSRSDQQPDGSDEAVGDSTGRAGNVAAGHATDIGRRQSVAGFGYRELPDAEVIGHTERLGLASDAREEFTPAVRSSLPPWPPARNATEGWRRLLTDFPELSPAITEAQLPIRRMADGLPEILDWNGRLRALGNSVVPLTVASAFIQLLAAHLARER